MEFENWINILSDLLDSSDLGMTAKRCLPAVSLSDSHLNKRRRRADTPDSSRLPSALPKQEPTRSSNGDDAADGFDEDSETSSSSSEVDITSEEMGSSDDEEEIGSARLSNLSPSHSHCPFNLSEEDELAQDLLSSDDDSSSSEDYEIIQTVPPQKKPQISAVDPASDLRSKLSSFLPKLQKANVDLQNPVEALSKRLDEVPDDEEHYIEMNLGLGVLKEKRLRTLQAEGVKISGRRTTSSSEDSSSDSMEAGNLEYVAKVERTPLADLMGCKKPSKEKPSIQEVPGS